MTGTAAITINTNLASLTVQKYLKDATKGMNTAMERLSTGFRINSAKDDAAGYSVAANMQAKINGYDIIEMNCQMGTDMLTTQEGVLDIINSYLQRIRDLTMQAANGTYGSASLEAIKEEVVQRMDEITRLCDITDFNGTYLLDGSRTTDINLQVGLYSDHRCVVTMDKSLFASAKSHEIMGFNADNLTGAAAAKKGYIVTDCVEDANRPDPSDGYDYPVYARDAQGHNTGDPTHWCKSAIMAEMIMQGKAAAAEPDATIPASSQDPDTGYVTTEIMCDAIYHDDGTARDFIQFIDKAIENISMRCTKIGAYANRLNSAVDSTDVQRSNLTEAVSTIKDADVAEVSSDYIKYQILQQSAASLLATANQMPSIALNLL